MGRRGNFPSDGFLATRPGEQTQTLDGSGRWWTSASRRRRAWVAAAAVLAALAVVGALLTNSGGTKTGAPSDRTTGLAGCMTVSAAALRAIRDGLPRGRVPRAPHAFKSEEPPEHFAEFPRGLREGVYFISAEFRPRPGVATWAVDDEFFRTGGGVVIAVDSAARALTDYGADLNPSELGLTEATHGFAESRACVR